MPKRRLRFTGLISFLVLVIVAVVLWFNRWNIYDASRLRNYQAPAQVVQLATDTTMNDKTRRTFYVYHPEIEDKTAFVQNCRSAEKTIVLGCYVPGNGIYLSNITDPRLAGIIQVTAAHETLHAAYDRLNPSDKAHIDALLNQTYEQVTDKRIRDTINAYRKDGADVTNELHSILGTEVRNLPPELETYYRRYFGDRLKVVAYSETYEQAFTARQQAVADFDSQLSGLKQQIESTEATLDGQIGSLKSERSRLDALLAAKQYDAYNAGVPGFNASVTAYNTSVGKTRKLIDQYNGIVSQRNAVALEETELVKAIDSRPETITTP